MKITVRRKGALGDVLNTTPVIRRLRQEHPDSWIVVETLHPAVYENNPYIQQVISPRISDKADLFVDLDMSYERNRKVHQVDANLLAAFGDASSSKEIDFPLSPAPDLGIMDWSRIITIHANRSWDSRSISPSWWERLISILRYEYKYKIVSLGTMQDPRIIGALDTRGALTLSQQASVIASSRLLICGDSSMFTLVGATETPAVGFCTITKSQYFMPYRHGELGWKFLPIETSLPCYGCSEDEPPSEYYPCRRGDNACVLSFDPLDVARRVVEFLGSTS